MKAAFLLHVEEEEKKEGLDNLPGLPSPSTPWLPQLVLSWSGSLREHSGYLVSVTWQWSGEREDSN